MKTIMIIGGTDSSGGAGLTRDAFMAHAVGFGVLPIVTAVTAQSDHAVRDSALMPADLVARQIRAALATADPAAIKIGMLGDTEIAEAVAQAIKDTPRPLVIDPVLRASSGGPLMSGHLPASLLSQARLITPNLPESAALSGRHLARTKDQIAAQADWFLSQGARGVLIKGGHGTGPQSDDHLFTASQRHILSAPRLAGTRRGTGCALATAIACALAEDDDLYAACAAGKKVIHRWLRQHL